MDEKAVNVQRKKNLDRPPENLENYCSRTSGSSETKYKEIKGGSKHLQGIYRKKVPKP